MNIPTWYIEAKHKSKKLDLFRTPYDCSNGEFNPLIVEKFVSKYLKKSDLVWEPFAGHIGPNKTIEICKSHDVNLIAYDINPCDERVVRADSLRCKPCAIDGLVFHPPYLGAAPMSAEDGELSLMSEDDYLDELDEFVEDLHDIMSSGYACVVARQLMQNGRKIPLDWIFCDIFTNRGFKLVEIFNAMPDWVMIMEKC